MCVCERERVQRVKEQRAFCRGDWLSEVNRLAYYVGIAFFLYGLLEVFTDFQKTDPIFINAFQQLLSVYSAMRSLSATIA